MGYTLPDGSTRLRTEAPLLEVVVAMSALTDDDVFDPGAYGNEMLLRQNSSGAIISTRLLGRHVERITFETASTDPKPVVAPRQPLGADPLRVVGN